MGHCKNILSAPFVFFSYMTLKSWLTKLWVYLFNVLGFSLPPPPTQCGLIAQVCQNVLKITPTTLNLGMGCWSRDYIKEKLIPKKYGIYKVIMSKVFIVLSMTIKIENHFQDYPGYREWGTMYLQLLELKQNKWLSIIIWREFHALCCF